MNDPEDLRKIFEGLNLEGDTNTAEADEHSNPVSVFAASVRQRYLMRGSTSLRPSSEIHKRQWEVGTSDQYNHDERVESEVRTPSVYARYYREKKKGSDDASSENIGLKDSKKVTHTLWDIDLSNGSRVVKELSMDATGSTARDGHDSEETFDQLDGEMEGSFVNKAAAIEAYDDSNNAQLGITSGFLSSAVQSWLPAFASRNITEISNIVQQGSTKSNSLLTRENMLDKIVDGVPIEYIENANSGLLSLLSAEGKHCDQEKLFMASVNEVNPMKKSRLLVEVLLGSAHGNNANESFEESKNLDDAANITLPDLPFQDFTGKPTLAVLDYLLDIFSNPSEEKKMKINLDRAWWMKEFDSKPVCLTYNNILQYNVENSNESKIGNGYIDNPSDATPLQEDLRESEDIEWEEILWAEARRHYHLAYTDDHDYDNTLKVSRFRALMETCLIAYVNTFHGQDVSGNSEGNLFTISNFVPFDTAKSLFTEIVSKYLATTKEFVSLERVSIESESKQSRNIDTYAMAICSALLEENGSFFRYFEINFVGKGGVEMDLEKQRNLIELTNPEDLSDRILVDEFLYGITRPELDREKLQTNEKILQTEVQMHGSLKRHIVRRHSNQDDHLYDTLISDVLLRCVKDAEAELTGILGVINNDDEKTKVPLSIAYAFKYVIMFLLKSFLVNKKARIELDTSEEDLNKSNVLRILTDSSFIRKRINIYGAFLATSDHLNDWRLLLSLQKITVMQRLYYSISDREQYCEIHKKVASELQYSLTKIVKTERELGEQGARRLLTLALDEESMGKSFSAHFRNVYRCMELGRSAYTLGLELGSNEKEFDLNDVSQENNLSEGDCFQIESADYQIATSSFSEASSILLSCKREIQTANKDILPGDQRKFSAYFDEIEGLSVSVDLFLGDTYVLKGFCNDIKYNEYDRAVICYREALRLYRHLGKKHVVVVSVMQNLGSANFHAQNWEDALSCFNHRLSLLEHIAKAQPESNPGSSKDKEASVDMSGMDKEFCITLQSIARVHGKLGNIHLAIKAYTEAIKRMRCIQQKPASSKSINPLEFLDECLSEVSAVHLIHARELFDEWSEIGFSSMFKLSSVMNLRPITAIFYAAVEAEQKAFRCLDESIQFRLGFEQSIEYVECRYSQQDIVTALQTIPLSRLHEFRQSVAQNGLYKFRQRRYVQAIADLGVVFKTYLSEDILANNMQVDEVQDLEIMQLPQMISPEFASDAKNYKLLPLIFQLGNLCGRIEDLHASSSFFSIALQICTNRFNCKVAGEKLGIQLDLAEIHRNLGVIHMRRGRYKPAMSHLRIASRLLDQTINEPSDEDRSKKDDFVLEAFVKLKIVVVLNYLGRVYDREVETFAQALVCFEDSMVILEDVFEELNKDSSLLVDMNSIAEIAKRSWLQKPPSLLQLGNVLGDNYLRAGKRYMSSFLLVDAELAFHRAISVYEEIKDDSYFLCDNENEIDILQSNDLNEALLDASKLALVLLNQNHKDEKLNDEGLRYDEEDLIFRIGNCLGELNRYDEALENLHQAKVMTEQKVGYDNYVIASICHNIGSVQCLKFDETGNDDARCEAIFAFKDAVNIVSHKSIAHHDLFLADCMFRVVQLVMVQSANSPLKTSHLTQDGDLLYYLETVLRIRLEHYDDSHSDVALTRYFLGKCYYFHGNKVKALKTLDQALSHWQNLYTSANLDIFDAIYFRGLCQTEVALSLPASSQFYQREVESASRYFLDSIKHSRAFFASVSNTIKDCRGLDVTCIIHSIRCALELAVTTKDERELKLKTILSTIKYSLDVYAIEKTEDFTILCDLAGNAWMCIAILNDMMGAYGTSVLANEAAVDFYLGLNDGNESNSVLKRAVATFMLASEYSKVDEKEKALKLYRASLNYIRDLDGDDTLEAAAISVYIGVKDYSVEHLEGALKIYKEKAHLTRESYYPGMGQEAILLKYMAMRKYQKSEFKIAFSSISSAITIFERVRVPAGQSLLKPPTTLKDVFLAAEDWDLHLLESYVIALQIAHRNEYVVDAFDIIKKIAVLFGEIEQFKQSFQCLYSLFLNLRRSNGDDDLTVANLLFNMSNLVGKANIGMGSALFHEEFIRITVATLGPNHPELIPSILHLGRLMLKSGQYEDALKWTDIGLSALEAMNSWGKDTMLLTLVKAEALLEYGKVSSAKRLLLQALSKGKATHGSNSRIHWLLGETYTASQQTKDAGLHYLEYLRSAEETNDSCANLEVKDAIGKNYVVDSLFGQAKTCFSDALFTATTLYGCDHVEVAKGLQGLAKVHSHSEPKRAEELLREGIRIYRLNPISKDLGSALFDMGKIFESKSEFKRAEECYIEASEVMKLSQGSLVLLANVNRAIALLYYRMQDLTAAKSSFTGVITLLRRIDTGNNFVLADCFYWLGCILYLLDEIEESQKSLRAGLSLFMKDRESSAKMVMLIKLAQARNYIRSRQIVEATDCLKLATVDLHITKKILLADELATVYALCGELYQGLQHVETAISYTMKAINIINRQANVEVTTSIGIHCQMIGMCCSVGEYGSAMKYATIYSRLVNANYNEKSKQAAKVYETLGNIENALYHSWAAISLYEKALLIQGETIHTVEYCELLFKLAMNYDAEEAWEKGIQTFLKIKKTAIFVQDSESFQIRATIGEASILFKLERRDEAVAIYLRILQDLKQFETTELFSSDAYRVLDSFELVHMFVDLGSYYLGNDAKECEWYLNYAAQLSFTHGLNSEIKWRNVMTKLASMHQDYLDIYGRDPLVISTGVDFSMMETTMGRLYIQSSNFKYAIIVFETLMKRQQHSNEELQLCSTLHNIGSCYLEMGQIKNAIPLLKDATETSKAILGFGNIAVADSMYALARAYSISSDVDASIPLLQNALKIRMHIYGPSMQVLHTLQAMGDILLDVGRIDGALKVLRDAKRLQPNISQKSDKSILNNTNFLIAKACIENGSLESSLEHLKIYIRNPYKRIGRLQPEIATSFYLAGRIHIERGEQRLADMSYVKASREIETQLGLGSTTNLSQELSTLQSTFQNQLLKFADLTLLYGTILKNRQNYNDAIACFDISSALFHSLLPPTSLRFSNVEFQKGGTLFEIEKYSDAIHTLNNSLTLRKQIFPEMAPHILEIKQLIGLCESRLGHTDKSLQLLKESKFMINIVRQKNRRDLKDAQAMFIYGKLHYEIDQISAAMDIYKRSMNLFRSLKSDVAERSILEVTVAVGNAYLKRGGHFRALMSFEQALFNSGGSQDDLCCLALSSVGNLYLELGRHKDAAESFDHCLRIQKKNYGDEHEAIAQTLISLGYAHAGWETFGDSKACYTQAISVLKQCYGDYVDVGKCWLKIAEIYVKEKREDQALRCYEQSLTILKSIETCDDYAWNVNQGTGECLLYLKRPQEAMAYLNNAFALASKIKDINKVSDSQLMIALAQFQNGEEKLALENSREAISFKILVLGDGDAFQSIFSAIDAALKFLSRTVGKSTLDYADFLQKKGICLAKMKHYQQALDVHKQAMSIYTTINSASHMSVKTSLFNIALCLISLGESTRARECLFDVYKIISTELGDGSSEMIDIQFYIGISFKQEGNFKSAKKYIDDAIQLRRLHSKYECKEAAEALESVGDVAADNKEYISIEIAEKYYIESLRLFNLLCCHKDVALLHFKLANLYVRAATYEKSIVHFEKSLVASRVLSGSNSSSVTEIYLNLGIAHDAMHSFDKAAHCYDFCIEHSSDSLTAIKARISKGRALSKIERFEEALQCLSDALSTHNDTQPNIEADILVAKGQVADLMNNNRLAMKSYFSALEIFRTLPRLELDVAKTLMEIANSHLRHKRYEEASSFASEAFEIRRNKLGIENVLTAESLYCKGSIMFGKCDYKEALANLELSVYNFNKTTINNSLKGNALYMIGCAQESLGHIDQAIESLKYALVLNEKRPEAHRNHKDIARTLRRLGAVFKLKGEYSKSRKYLKKSLLLSVSEFGPHHCEVAQTHEFLAGTLYLEGNHEEALQHVQATLDIYDSDGNSTILGRCYCLKGVILDQTSKDSELAIKVFKTSIEHYESSPDDQKDYMGLASAVLKLATLQDCNQIYPSATKNYIKANNLYKRALKSSQTLYSADIFERLANIKGHQKKYDKACALLDETLKIRVQILGMEHESVAQALFSLGIIFSKRNDFDASLKALTDCLSIRQLQLGFDSVETADTLYAIGQCLGNSGDYEHALNLWNEALDIYKKHGDQGKLRAIQRDLDLGLRLSEG